MDNYKINWSTTNSEIVKGKNVLDALIRLGFNEEEVYINRITPDEVLVNIKNDTNFIGTLYLTFIMLKLENRVI